MNFVLFAPSQFREFALRFCLGNFYSISVLVQLLRHQSIALAFPYEGALQFVPRRSVHLHVRPWDAALGIRDFDSQPRRRSRQGWLKLFLTGYAGYVAIGIISIVYYFVG